MSIYEYTPALIYTIILAICIGAAFGSFLNCAAWRIVHGESFLKGRSHCPACGHSLTAAELIPVLSWVFQKGRCKACGDKISIRYPLTELIFAAVTVLCVLRFDLSILCLRNFLFLCILFLLTLTDIEDMTIPDGCHIAAVILWVVTKPFLFDGWQDILFSVLAAVIFGGGLLLISLLLDRILGKESLGGGDIKLFAVIGLYMGLIGTLFVVVIACILGLVFAIIARMRSSDDEEEEEEEDSAGQIESKAAAIASEDESSASEGETSDSEDKSGDSEDKSGDETGDKEEDEEDYEVSEGAFPFGPWIAIAAGFVLLYGEPMINWYRGLLGV